MSNFIIDDYPREIMGLPIRTDFRVWVAVEQMLENPLSMYGDTICQIINLVFKERRPSDCVTAFSEIVAFLMMYEEQRNESNDQVFSWQCDSKLVYSAFRKTYGIDLKSIEYMHIWEFKSLFADISSDTTLATIMSYRGINLSDYEGEQRQRMAELKAKYAIR